MTAALATPEAPKKFDLLPGQQHPFTIGDTGVTVAVQCIRYNAAYSVTAYQRTLRLDDLCGSFATEQDACLAARGICQMYAREVTA